MSQERECLQCGEMLRPAMVRCMNCGTRRDQTATPAAAAEQKAKPASKVSTGTIDPDDASDMLSMLPDVSGAVGEMATAARTSVATARASSGTATKQNGPVIMKAGRQLEKQSLRDAESNALPSETGLNAEADSPVPATVARAAASPPTPVAPAPAPQTILQPVIQPVVIQAPPPAPLSPARVAPTQPPSEPQAASSIKTETAKPSRNGNNKNNGAASARPGNNGESQKTQPTDEPSSQNVEGKSNESTDRPRRKNKKKKSQTQQPTVSIECACGKVTTVVESTRTRKKRCRNCQAELLIPGTEDQAATEDAAKRLHEAIQDAVKKPITEEGESATTSSKKLSTRALAQIGKSLTVTNPLSESEARARFAEIRKAAESGDPAVAPAIEKCATDEFPFVRQAAADGLAQLAMVGSSKAVLPLLEDPERDVVCAAIRCLNASGDTRAIYPLLCLAKARFDVQLQSLDTIVKLAESHVSDLIALAASADADLQADIAFVLGKLADPSAIPVLISLLNDNDQDSVRAAATEAIGRIGDPRTAGILTGLLKDRSREVRRNAVISLKRVPTRQSTTFLVPLLKDPDVNFRCHVIAALAASGDPRCVPHVVKFVFEDEEASDAPDEPLLSVIADALAEIEHESAASALSVMLESEFDAVVLKSLAAIRKRHLDTLGPQVVEATTHASATIRRHAAETLGALDDPASADVLCQLLENDPSEEVCLGAARALGKLGDSLAVPFLEDALKREASIRCAAVVALGEIRSPSAQPALLAMLQDTAPEVRYQAAMSLARMEAKETEPAIAALLTDPDPFVQTGAGKALEMLGAEETRPSLANRLRTTAGRMVPDWAASFIPRSPAMVGSVVAGLLVAAMATFFALNVTAAPRIILRGDVSDIRFSADNSQLMITRSRGSAEVWDLATGEIARDIPLSSASYGALGPGGKQATLITGKQLARWNVETTDTLSEDAFQELSDAPVRWAGFPADRSFGVLAATTEVIIWDMATGQAEGKIPVSPLGRFGLSSSGSVFVESFGPTLRFGNPKERSLESLETSLTKEMGQVRTVAVNNDGTIAALCLTSNKVLIVPLNEEGEPELLEARTGRDACFGADGQLWLVHSNSVSRLNLKTGESKTSDIDDVDVVDKLAISPDGSTLCVASSESDQVWLIDAASMQLKSTLRPPVAVP